MRLSSSPIAVAIAVFAMLVTSACSTLEHTVRPDADKIAAFPLTHRAEVERLDLGQLIVDQAALNCPLSNRDLSRLEENANPYFSGRRVDEALGCFNAYAQRDSRAAVMRNAIQERILAASVQRCSEFKALLQRKQADASFWSGLATAGFAAAGAITNSVEGARTLAGLSGLSSAYGAEYNQAYFSNLAAHVIIAGIELQRQKIYEQIMTDGQSKPIETYSLQAAIKDAFRFHGACNITTGLVQAQDAIKTVENPGLNILQRALVKNRMLQNFAKADGKDVPASIEAWKEVIRSEPWLAGTPLVTSVSTAGVDPARAVNYAERIKQDATDVQAEFKQKVDGVLKARKDAKLLTETTAGLVAAKDRVDKLGREMMAVAQACIAPAAALAQGLIKLQAQLHASTDSQTRAKLEIDVTYENQKIDAFNGALTERWVNLVTCKRRLDGVADDLQAASKTEDAAINKAINAINAVTGGCAAEIAAPSACAAAK